MNLIDGSVKSRFDTKKKQKAGEVRLYCSANRRSLALVSNADIQIIPFEEGPIVNSQIYKNIIFLAILDDGKSWLYSAYEKFSPSKDKDLESSFIKTRKFFSQNLEGTTNLIAQSLPG